MNNKEPISDKEINLLNKSKTAEEKLEEAGCKVLKPEIPKEYLEDDNGKGNKNTKRKH